MNEKKSYIVCDDGFAQLRDCEEVYSFFSDNDVIGKTVKSADQYILSQRGSLIDVLNQR